MAVKFRDYYEILGVPKTASPEQIQRAFRDLARKYHPDVDKRPDANQRFSEINEAYEVLKDPEKRKRYDTLGSGYRQGQEFRPPPGWEGAQGNAEDLSGFSDFFRSVFGNGMFGGGPFVDIQVQRGPGGRRGRRTTRTWQTFGEEPEDQRASDVEFKLNVTPWDAALGAEVQLRGLERPVVMKIPPGTQGGQKLRLRGMGQIRPDGTRGDAYIIVRIVVPQTLSARERELFEALRKESRFKPENG